MEKKRILVIDDEPQVTHWLKLMLGRTGDYTVRELNDPCRAVIAAEEFQPDMIFSDINMPEMDGGDVAISLRQYYSREIPIVFLSSLVSRKEATDGVVPIAGHDFLAKPISKNEVIRCIEAHLGAATTGVMDIVG